MAANPSRHTVHYVGTVYPIIHPIIFLGQLLVTSTKS
jgi:hypothetical protein